MRALIYGLAVAGASTVRALQRRGFEVIVADDDVTADRLQLAEQLNVDVFDAPDDAALRSALAGCELVCPSPGVPETHRVVEAARRTDTEIVSEIELAYRWEQARPGGPRPMLAVTGTDGKTTTTLMAVAMLRAADRSTVDAGNTETPLVAAIDDDHDAFVVECTSFRLAWTRDFRAEAAAWLNLAPDHLNWHVSMDSYAAAKAKIWSAQRADDVAIAYSGSPAVLEQQRRAPGRHITFGPGGDYRMEGDRLVGPRGTIVTIDQLRRSLPHDITNALAASAMVLETGLADESAIGRALAGFHGPPHRLEWLGSHDDVEWYNDSKATTPHAAAAAIRSFEDIVLIAGGKDKRVDLSEMAVESNRVKAVIAIGETRHAVASVFADAEVVETTEFLPEAVERARAIAIPGDTVLLSPGCASLDQYRSFEERGDHFRQLAPAVQPSGGEP